jgi:hypothetical protein
MKKLLLLGAAALLASTLGANAGPTSNSVSLILRSASTTHQHEDLFRITQTGDDYFAQQHTRQSTTGYLNESFGVGMTASTPDIYKGIMLTDFGKNGTYQACYDIQYPFVNGGHWVAYRTVDGQHVNMIASGTYTVVPPTVSGM